MTSVKEGTRLMRTQFPLAAAFALTVNKAQGLTLKEGVVIHLMGGARFRPASKHGLPFVAWTHSESFAMTAFKHITPCSDVACAECLYRKALRVPSGNTHDEWVSAKVVDTSVMPQEPPRLPCPACANLCC